MEIVEEKDEGKCGGEGKKGKRKESLSSLSPRLSPPQSPLLHLRTSRSFTPRHRRGKTKEIFKIAHII